MIFRAYSRKPSLLINNKVSRLKADFEPLCTEGKITSESKVPMQSMFMIVELILAIFIEKSTKKNNKNSSKPSPQTKKNESALDHKGSKGKGKHKNSGLADNTRTNESITISKVDSSSVCGESLTDVLCVLSERRTKIDIVFEKVAEHVDAEVKQCSTCHSIVKNRFPSDMQGPLQYGDGLKVFVINLLVCQIAALNRVQKLVKSMIGVVISEASLLKLILRLYLALDDWEAQTIEQILQTPAIHVDETSLRVDKKNHWIHVYSSGELTLKFLHRKRGKKAIESIHIIPRYGGAIIHDCWSSYFSYQHCGHGLCGSHLLRELTFIFESNEYRWALNMKRLLQETCIKASKSTEKKLCEKDLANLQKRYRNILTRGEKELPPISPKPNRKRGKIA